MNEADRQGAGAPPAVVIERISKRFGGVQALSEVSLTLSAGEIHALCGENGAGKSTLIKVLAGAHRPDSGRVLAGGRELAPGSVRAAEAAGIAVIYQEAPVFPELTVAENLAAGRAPRGRFPGSLDRPAMRAEALRLLGLLHVSLSPDQRVSTLSTGERQAVVIARALARQCRCLVLDEPTSSLSARETEALFSLIRRLRAQGTAILYVSHRLEEIFQLADRVTVLRDGRWVATRPAAELDSAALIRLMVGRDIESPVLHRTGGAAPGPAALEIRNLTRPGEFYDINLTVRSGEIVGLAGLVGAGRSELARCVFGLTRPHSGAVLLGGAAAPAGDVPATIRRGAAMAPEDRRTQGLVLPLSVRENLGMIVHRVLARSLFRNRAAERETAESAIRALDIRCASPAQPAALLSGGNQQKVVLGKWLALEPRVLLLDEPTRGVDVGAKAEIHRLIRELAERKAAVLVISSELPEILALSDRIVVLREGRISGELSRAEATPERVLELALPRGAPGGEDGISGESAGREGRGAPRGRPAAVADSAARSPARGLGRGRRRELSLAGILVLLVAAVSAVNPHFLEAGNLRDVLTNAVPAVIVGCGVTFVIACAEIDISVGSMMGLLAAVLGVLTAPSHLGLPVWAGVAGVLVLGGALGLINGALVAFAGIPSIIVTLGMLTVLRGLTRVLMHGEWITDLPGGVRFLGIGSVLGVSPGIWAAAGVAVLAWGVARWGRIGLDVFAVGSNPEAAALRGISRRRVVLFAFTLAGVLTAVATLVSVPQQSVIESGIGEGLALLVITCVVVGGTSILGGTGTIPGTVLAALLLTMIGTVLIFLRLGQSAVYWERTIQGAFILAAVLADHLLRRRRVD